MRKHQVTNLFVLNAELIFKSIDISFSVIERLIISPILFLSDFLIGAHLAIQILHLLLESLILLLLKTQSLLSVQKHHFLLLKHELLLTDFSIEGIFIRDYVLIHGSTSDYILILKSFEI
jgi:hypothetical protein